MKSPKEHYDSFLSEKYAWMLGDWKEKEEEQFYLFQTWGLAPKGKGLAWDLGAGNGLQSLALERLGFDVLALDLSDQLLSEISIRKPDTKIRTKTIDIRNPELYRGEAPELLVCMGDTLPHLDSAPEVENLVSIWSSFLRPGSLLAIAYRDLSYGKQGNTLGFNVRSERDRIFSCILRFGEEKTEVTDIFQEWKDGAWVFSASSYNKLNLPLDRFLILLDRYGFSLKTEEEKKGMRYILAEKS